MRCLRNESTVFLYQNLSTESFPVHSDLSYSKRIFFRRKHHSVLIFLAISRHYPTHLGCFSLILQSWKGEISTNSRECSFMVFLLLLFCVCIRLETKRYCARSCWLLIFLIHILTRIMRQTAPYHGIARKLFTLSGATRKVCERMLGN